MNAFEEWANAHPDMARRQIEALRATGRPLPPAMEAWATGRVYIGPTFLASPSGYTPASVGPVQRDADIEAALDSVLGPAPNPAPNLTNNSVYDQGAMPGLAARAQQVAGGDARLMGEGPAAAGVNPATTQTQDRLPMNPPEGVGELRPAFPWLPGSPWQRMPNGEIVPREQPFVGGEGMQAFNVGGRDTLTLGFDDELAGAFGGDIEAMRLEKERLQQLYPAQYMGGQLAGALPAMALPAGPLAGGTGVLARVGGAALGAGLPMAAYGVGSGTTAGERLAGGAAMGALGTGLGLVAPVVGSLAGKALGGAVRRFLPGGRTSAATRAVSEAFEADQGMPANVTQLGPEGMVADTGANTQQLGASVAARPGAGQQIMRTALGNRTAGAGARVRADMASAMPNINLPKSLRALDAARSNAARPLYNQAYAVAINGTPFDAILQTPAGMAAWRTASRLAANEGQRLDRANLTTRAIDYVKRAFDDQIAAARKAGQSEQVRALEGLRTSLLKEIDTQVPAYKAARAAYAGPSALMDALEQGREVFARTLSPDELTEELGRLSSAERDAFILGARQQVEQIMGTARNDAGAAIRELAQKGWNAEKLRILLGRGQATQLLKALQREQTFATTADAVTRNSETARRLSGMVQLDKAGQSVRSAYEAGGFMGLLRAGGLATVDKFLRGLTGDQIERVTADIARQLSAQGPERQLVLQSLMQIRNNNATVGRVRSTVNRIIQKLTQAGAIGTEGQTVGPMTGGALQLAQ